MGLWSLLSYIGCCMGEYTKLSPFAKANHLFLEVDRSVCSKRFITMQITPFVSVSSTPIPPLLVHTSSLLLLVILRPPNHL